MSFRNKECKRRRCGQFHEKYWPTLFSCLYISVIQHKPVSNIQLSFSIEHFLIVCQESIVCTVHNRNGIQLLILNGLLPTSGLTHAYPSLKSLTSAYLNGCFFFLASSCWRLCCWSLSMPAQTGGEVGLYSRQCLPLLLYSGWSGLCGLLHVIIKIPCGQKNFSWSWK